MDNEGNSLSIGELAARTGVAPATLRVWEERHGYPAPERRASGHRRYPATTVDGVLAVVTERRRGLSLALAIERVRRIYLAQPESIFAELRRSRRDLRIQRLRKPALLALSRAIEDEYFATGGGGLLAASFQRTAFYRASEARWLELAPLATASFVLADFSRFSARRDHPAKVPTPRDHPASREWAVICDSPSFTACMVGLELIGQGGLSDRDRRFEVIWSLDSSLVRDAATRASTIARRRAPQLGDDLDLALAHPHGLVDPGLALAASERMVDYLARSASRGVGDSAR